MATTGLPFQDQLRTRRARLEAARQFHPGGGDREAPGRGAEEAARLIEADVDAFRVRGGRRDDVTLLVLRREG
jgi:hypothetical protein